MSNTREFDDASFEDFLDSVPEVEPPAQLIRAHRAHTTGNDHCSCRGR